MGRERTNNGNSRWPRLLDLRGAGEYLSVSSTAIRDWVLTGILNRVDLPGTHLKDAAGNTICLPANHKMKKFLIDREDLDKFVEKLKTHNQ